MRFFIFTRLAFFIPVFLISVAASAQKPAKSAAPFVWENANVYFLLTDRFQNGNPANDVQFDRTKPTATLRGFMGGDIRGISQKVDEGYFDQLGISALWFTPVVEQIHAIIDEGTGATYGYHGYWAKDWTAFDPSFGTVKDFGNLVRKAHKRGIRVILDVVINHTGPSSAQDPLWPGWVRTEPNCTYKNYETTTACTLVKNLPDILTESNKPVDIPPFLAEKWKREGRYEREVAELDAFFKRTGYPRAPRFYIIKWLCDYIRRYGVDGFRCDTAKHLEESVWAELRKEADNAFADWKHQNAKKVLDDNEFYMVGEVYDYKISGGRAYDFGDKKVDFFANGFNSLLNFDLKNDARGGYESIFAKYDRLLRQEFKGKSVLNYLTSHDDGGPFDKERKKAFESGTKLLLCPGASQVYYGDETARNLVVSGTQGDATLRSFMNWDEVKADGSRNGQRIREVLAHWQKLGRFRRDHPAVGAGAHTQLLASPYLFKRTFQKGAYEDAVIAALDWPVGRKEIATQGTFANGTKLLDYYSGQMCTVEDGKAIVNSPFGIVLLGRK